MKLSAVLVSFCLILSLTIQPIFAQDKTARLKEKIVNWGQNKNVSVKLKTGEQITGRISEIKDDYFAVQSVNLGQVTTRQINFDEVQSASGKGETDARTLTRYIFLGSGVLFTVLAVVSLTKSNDRPQPVFSGN